MIFTILSLSSLMSSEILAKNYELNNDLIVQADTSRNDHNAVFILILYCKGLRLIIRKWHYNFIAAMLYKSYG